MRLVLAAALMIVFTPEYEMGEPRSRREKTSSDSRVRVFISTHRSRRGGTGCLG